MNLINTADLKSELKNGIKVTASAGKLKDIEGWFLNLYFYEIDEFKTLSTYLYDKPRYFKTSQALLNELHRLGLTSVAFNLSGNIEDIWCEVCL